MDIPLGTAEPKADGQFTLQGRPELLPLLIRHVQDDVVVPLQLLILLDDAGVPVLALTGVVAVASLLSEAAPALYTTVSYCSVAHRLPEWC